MGPASLLLLGIAAQLITAGVVQPRQTVSCVFWAVAESGDTCATFAAGWGLSAGNFARINPTVLCPGPLETGKEYCAVGSVIAPQPTSSSTARVTTSTSTSTTIMSTTTTTSPTATTTPNGPQPQMSGTVSNCNMYHKIRTGDGCESIEQSYGISPENLRLWNPSINSNCDNMPVDYYICVGVPGSTGSTPSPLMPNTIDSCSKFHKFQAGEGCKSIEQLYGITSEEFRTWNPSINSVCSNLLVDYYVCIGVPPPSPLMLNTIGSCSKFHKFQAGEGCESIEQLFGITSEDLRIWNPSINSACSNLLVDYYICIGVPPPSPLMPNTIASCSKFHKFQAGEGCQSIEQSYGISSENLRLWNPSINSACSNLLVDYYICVGVPPSLPLMPNTIASCNKYHKFQAGEGCKSIEQLYGITSEDFRTWNPSINSICNNLLVDFYVCIGVPPPSPQMPNTIGSCSKFHKFQAGEGCQSIEQSYGISSENLRLWNPSINSACSNLLVDYYICVGVPPPSPLMPNTIGNCNKYHRIQSGDGCWSIEQSYAITPEQLQTWNPSIDSSCTNLWLDYYICVGVPGSSGGSTAPPTTGPSPQMPNTVSNCRTFFKVGSGDSCWTIEQAYGISATQFQSWNPYVDASCSNLWLDYYVCVGV
jgi:LysM repeat protein